MSDPLRRAVFFDRDGVLNDAIIRDGKPYPPATLDELRIPRDARLALAALSQDGFLLIGVTNQPDVARGTQQRPVVEAMNAALVARLGLREIFTCYHDDDDHCTCRKPQPGLILEAAGRYSIDLSRSFLVGDRWKDVEAGRRAGCTPIQLGDGYDEPHSTAPASFRASTLREAASWIIQDTHARGEQT